jgi:hypothetical protein
MAGSRGRADAVPVNGGRRLQAPSFELEDGSVMCYFHRGKVHSQLVIDAMDDFIKSIRQPTIAILDSSPVQTSGQFPSQIKKWKHRGLSLYFLPCYSPELNAIEHLWKNLKYQFMSSDARGVFQSRLDYAKALIKQCVKATPMPSLQGYTP